MMPKEKPPITVVGDVGGRIAIIVVSFRLLLEPCLLCDFGFKGTRQNCQ